MSRATRRFAILALAGWLLALLQGNTPAGVLGRNPFHVVHRAPNPAGAAVRGRRALFRDRLHPRTRQNLRGIGVYHAADGGPNTGGWGTAFLVAHEPDGTALVLTNDHVLQGIGAGAVTFEHEGRRPTRAPVTRVVARSAQLDYALVRVTLPAGADVPALQLAARRPSERVYSAGFDSLKNLLSDTRLGSFDWVDRDRLALEALPAGPVQSIQTGQVLFGGETRRVRAMRDPSGRRVNRKRTGASQRASTSLAGLGGGSGRPIIDAGDHRVVAIHASSGIVSRRTAEVDLRTRRGAASAGASQVVLVRHMAVDLARRLAEGVIAPRDRDAVGRLLSSAAR